MDNRLPPGTSQRPPLLQRAVSGGSVSFPPRPRNPYLQSPLGNRSNIRSISQPTAAVDLTLDDAEEEDSNSITFSVSKASSSSSPIVLDDDDEAEQPPAKRPKTTGAAFRAEGNKSDGQVDRAHRVIPGSPLPSLPAPPDTSFSARGPIKRDRTRGGAAARRPQGNDPPALAIRVPAPKNVADFSPWSGHHPEDIMNETAVKSGYFDKGANQNESNSARPSIWPNLSQKNHMGLQTLSYLFAQVMEKRQVLGKCTSASTFKPPPRVTVTDTKREAWLRDLANPDIPLRKQSRTIPHGIRGKVLMEQCLSKDIPLPRAVWLAKCVGANELRAFRRKGVSGVAAASGESKWAREWTISVELFIEGVISTCGHPDWQSHMNYSVRLATHFYAERLLDMDHFLDWIISSLADAVLERLPIWIMLTQLFWKDLTRFVKRGRKLALTILNRLHVLSMDESKVQQALKTRLEKLVAALIMTNRACLVVPTRWPQYRHLLTTTRFPTQYHTHLEHVISRNERLTGSSKEISSTKSAILTLYATLDGISLAADRTNMSANCLAIMSDPYQLVSALLEWASTHYRSGLARIYLAASIISDLHYQGHDTDQAILSFLEQTSHAPAVRADNVYIVIARLIVTKSFSVGAYLQRLITRADTTADSPNLTRGLLTALPVDQLAPNTRNLRRTLLERLELRDDSSTEVQQLLAKLDQDLASGEDNKFDKELPGSKLSLACKLALGTELRDRLSNAKGRISELATFCTFRAWIECVQDVPLLADLLSQALQHDDPVLLATVADTVNTHADTLATIDQLSSLSQQLAEKYRVLRSQQPLERTSIVALTGLFQRLPGNEAVLKTLENDLPICDQQMTSAACSPASDNLIGVQSNGVDSENDLDAVFASGNTMDQQLMERIFARIISLAGKAQTSCSTRLCSWLRQLKCFDPTTFDQIATRFVEQQYTTASPAAGISAIIASGCLTFDAYVNGAEQGVSSSSATAAIRAIFALDENLGALRKDEQYRYKLLAHRFRDENSTRVVRLLLTSFDAQQEDSVLACTAEFILEYTCLSDDVSDMITSWSGKSDNLYSNLTRVFMSLVNQAGLNAKTVDLDAQAVLQLARPLSIHLCVMALESLSKFEKFQKGSAEAVLQERIEESVSQGEGIWPKLLYTLGPGGKARLHDWAQDKLLFAPAATSDVDNTDMIDRCLEVMNLTRGALNATDDQAVATALVDKLKEVEKRLSSIDQHGDAIRYLDVLLHIAALSIKPEPAAEGDNSRQADASLMATLCSLLANPSLQTRRDLLDCMFDLATVLYDGLPEAAAAAMSKLMLSAKSTAPYILAIVGDISSGNPDAWLALASQIRPPGSQAQQALARHASQQGQPTPRAPAPTSGQSTTSQRNWLGQGTAIRGPVDMKLTPYPLRRWELMPDAAPSMGENDASLSLSLFGARKV